MQVIMPLPGIPINTRTFKGIIPYELSDLTSEITDYAHAPGHILQDIVYQIVIRASGCQNRLGGKQD
jgi:hypothetical protein